MSKPMWRDAPNWAAFLAQDKDGEWCWWNLKPNRTASLWTQGEPEESYDYLSAGYIDRDGNKFPLAEDWTTTLETRP